MGILNDFSRRGQAAMTFYHATGNSRVKDILKRGLLIEHAGDWSDQPAIYLAGSIEQAAGYFGRDAEDTDAVLAIDGNQLDQNYLVMDDDAMNQMSETGKKYNPKDWKKSLKLTNQVAYLKNIPKSAVSLLYGDIGEDWEIPAEPV
jgi:hypothetical protein